MQMLPARLGQAVGSALLRGRAPAPGPDRDRTGTGGRRGRTGAGPAPLQRRAPAAEPAGSCRRRRAGVQVRVPGWGGGDSHGSTGSRPRSGVTGTGEGERGRAVVAAHPQAESVCPDGAPFRGVAAPSIQPAAPSGRTGRGSGAGPGRCRCGRAGAPRAALGTAEPRPPPRRLGMAGYKKPVVCAALGAVIFTRVCAGRNARV